MQSTRLEEERRESSQQFEEQTFPPGEDMHDSPPLAVKESQVRLRSGVDL